MSPVIADPSLAQKPSDDTTDIPEKMVDFFEVRGFPLITCFAVFLTAQNRQTDPTVLKPLLADIFILNLRRSAGCRATFKPSSDEKITD